ncbi:MAG: Tetratricopeptide 2 repeat protein, partial [Deltaproteobacteria bacterium]|nr:Tetratricopeptide 2 repeat protein [Deltaproteobacteria bacterium]
MTGALVQSAFVAMLFALHPLHVESVAWISERKDVLSTLFWILVIMCYSWYAKKPYYSQDPSTPRYILVLLLFLLGLMSKPMLV